MAERRQSEWRILGFGIGAGLVIVLLLAASFAVGYNLGQSDERSAATQATAGASAPSQTAPTATGGQASSEALTLFSQTCGSCHTLSAAGTTGTVGPNLDDLKPSTEQVLAAIENGGLGSGTMPPNILQGAEAEQVAQAVSAAAGG